MLPSPPGLFHDKDSMRNTLNLYWTQPFLLGDSKRWWLDRVNEYMQKSQKDQFPTAKAQKARPMPIPLTISQSDKGIEQQPEEQEGVI